MNVGGWLRGLVARQAHRNRRLRQHRRTRVGHSFKLRLPANCMNEDRDFTCEMEPDQDAGFCEECCTNSMQSAPILAELI